MSLRTTARFADRMKALRLSNDVVGNQLPSSTDEGSDEEFTPEELR